MAGRASYPTSADLSLYLVSMGVKNVPAAQVAIGVLAGIQAFEGDCDRHFHAEKTIDNTPLTASMRAFDLPSDGVLRIPDLAAAPAIVYAPNGSTPTAYVAGTDYRMEPLNALAEGRPYTSVLLGARYPYAGYWGVWGSGFDTPIQITGKWGYGLLIPEDAWQAMLMDGASFLLDQWRLEKTGGMASWSTSTSAGSASDSSGGGIDTFGAAMKRWMVLRDSVVRGYRRLWC